MPGGTRFKLYPQLGQGYQAPETVEIAAPAGSVGTGPQTARLYVANAVAKATPYRLPADLPPYRGRVHPPARPDPDGHFDHIPEDSPQFLAAHTFGAACRVLDIWEGYLGRSVPWWHAARYPRLELVPHIAWGNAHSGPGFLELGQLWTRQGVPRLLCLNLDVVGHEIGHTLLFSLLGAPAPGRLTGAFLAFHETFADHVAAIAALHFDSVVRRLLQQTNGNLYALNLVSRLGELSDSEQVRVLDNEVTLRSLGGLRLGPQGWIDPLGLDRRQHAAAAPMTGAVWDCLVEVYQESLVARGLIPPDLDTRGWSRDEVRRSLDELQRSTGDSLARHEKDFAGALRVARDITGLALARTASRLTPDDLDFAQVAARFCEALAEVGPAHLLPAHVQNFLERDIDPRPLLRRVAPSARPFRRVEPAPLRGTGFGCRHGRDLLAVAAVNSMIEHPHRGAAALAGG